MLCVLLIMLTAGSVDLANASIMGAPERIVLNASTFGNIPFNLTWSYNGEVEVYPYFMLRFNTKDRHFNVNGLNDPDGFLDETQISRFTVTVTESGNGLLAVNIHIANVEMVDAAIYIFTVILFNDPDNWDDILVKEVEVRISRGPAHCRITNSNYSPYLREAHCSATRGDEETSITCYQYGKKVPYNGPINMSGPVTIGVFWLDKYGPVSCCSHGLYTRVLNEKICKDFIYPGREEDSVDISTTEGFIMRNDPVRSSLPPFITVTDSGCTKQSETILFVHYLYLFLLTIFLIS